VTDPTRNKDLSRIHIYKKDLGLDDETYRAMLLSLTGKASAGEMDYRERWQVIQEMAKRLPADKRHKTSKKNDYPGRPPVNKRIEPQVSKIEALLADMKLPWKYAETIIRNQTKAEYPPNGISAVGWCNPKQLRGVITALNNHKKSLDAQAAKAKAKAVGHE